MLLNIKETFGIHNLDAVKILGTTAPDFGRLVGNKVRYVQAEGIHGVNDTMLMDNFQFTVSDCLTISEAV